MKGLALTFSGTGVLRPFRGRGTGFCSLPSVRLSPSLCVRASVWGPRSARWECGVVVLHGRELRSRSFIRRCSVTGLRVCSFLPVSTQITRRCDVLVHGRAHRSMPKEQPRKVVWTHIST